MIVLDLNKHREWKVGDKVHIRVTEIRRLAAGKWRVFADDVTPLPGAEPDGYGCGICGIIEQADPDGSLPEGWEERKYTEGSFYVCPQCTDEPVCRVCGCTNENACEGGCHWVEENLCSACKEKGKGGG